MIDQKQGAKPKPHCSGLLSIVPNEEKRLDTLEMKLGWQKPFFEIHDTANEQIWEGKGVVKVN